MLSLLVAVLTTPSAAPLDGRWISPCLAMGQNGRHGTIFTLTIDRDVVTLSGRTYAHANCDAPTIETRLTGTLDNLARHDRRTTATLTIGDVTMTPRAPDVVAAWNVDRAAKHCAPRDWHLDQAQSVAGGACMPGHRFPARYARLSVAATIDGARLTLPYPLPGGNGTAVTLTRAQWGLISTGSER